MCSGRYPGEGQESGPNPMTKGLCAPPGLPGRRQVFPASWGTSVHRTTSAPLPRASRMRVSSHRTRTPEPPGTAEMRAEPHCRLSHFRKNDYLKSGGSGCFQRRSLKKELKRKIATVEAAAQPGKRLRGWQQIIERDQQEVGRTGETRAGEAHASSLSLRCPIASSQTSPTELRMKTCGTSWMTYVPSYPVPRRCSSQQPSVVPQPRPE